jgi:hypothetical protein
VHVWLSEREYLKLVGLATANDETISATIRRVLVSLPPAKDANAQ